jgi:hypothetical protein
MVFFDQKLYFVSLNNAAIYEMNLKYTTIDENIVLIGKDPSLVYAMQWIRICNHVRLQDTSKFRVNGLVLTIDQGNDPLITQLDIDGRLLDLITESDFNPPEDEIITEDGAGMVDELANGGVGVNTELIYRPRVDLSFSKDGGESWSNTVTRLLNPIGKRQNMLHWEKMGQANDIILKFRFWGTSRFVVNNGLLDIC